MNLDVSSPLAQYAANHWIIHAHSGCKTKSQLSSIFPLITDLLTDENNAFLNWVRIYGPDEYHEMDLQRQRNEIAEPLYYASLAGSTEALNVLLQMGADVNAQGEHHGNALQAASFQGHEVITKQLIEKGARTEERRVGK